MWFFAYIYVLYIRIYIDDTPYKARGRHMCTSDLILFTQLLLVCLPVLVYTVNTCNHGNMHLFILYANCLVSNK